MTSVHCSELLEKLYRYLDGELPEDEVATLQKHIDDCHPCLQRVRIEREFKVLIYRSCSEKQAPATLIARIREAIRDQ